MRLLDYLILGLTAFIPHLEFLFLQVVHDWTHELASSTATSDLLSSGIISQTVGPSSSSNEHMMDAASTSHSAPNSAVGHPLTDSVTDWAQQLLSIEQPNTVFSMSIGEFYMLALALVICIGLCIKLRPSLSLPPWLDEQLGSDSDSPFNIELSPWEPTVLSSKTELPQYPQTLSDRLSQTSGFMSTRLPSKPSVSLPSPSRLILQDEPEEIILSPIMFSDPTSFSSDGLDAPHGSALSEISEDVLEKCEDIVLPCSEPQHVNYSPSVPDSLPLSCQRQTATVLDASADPVAVPSDTKALAIDNPPVPTPSFDFLAPLATASSNLKTQLLQERFEESLLNEALGSAGLMSPIQDESLDDNISEGAVDRPDQKTPDLETEVLTATLPICDDVNTVQDISAPLPLHEDPVNSPSSDVLEVPFSTPVVLASASGDDVAAHLETPENGDIEEPRMDSSPTDQHLGLFSSSSSLLTPSSSLSDLINEPVNATDLTTLKCWYSMVDDEANVSSPKQMTFVRDYRTPVHFPDPYPVASLEPSQSLSSCSDPLSSPLPSSESLSSWSTSSRLRTLTEPPVNSVREVSRSDIELVPTFSVTKFKRDILESDHCPVVPSEFVNWFERASPLLQQYFPLLLSRMGIIPHDRSFIRFQPKTEQDLALAAERRALMLVAAAWQHKGPLLVARRHSVPSLSNGRHHLPSSEFPSEYPQSLPDRSLARTTTTGVGHSSGITGPDSEDASGHSVPNNRPRPLYPESGHSQTKDDLNNLSRFEAEDSRHPQPVVVKDDSSIIKREGSSRSRTLTESGALSAALSSQLGTDRRIPSWIPSPAPRASTLSRRRTTTFQSDAFGVHGQTEEVQSHNRASSDGSSLAQASEAELPPSCPSPGATTGLSYAVQVHAPVSSYPGCDSSLSPPKAMEPPALVVPSHSVSRRRSFSRPPPLSLVGTPRLATIIGSPATSPPATIFTTMFPEISSASAVEELAAIASGSGFVSEATNASTKVSTGVNTEQ